MKECSDSTQLHFTTQQTQVMNQMRDFLCVPSCPLWLRGSWRSRNFTQAPRSAITRTGTTFPESTSPDNPNPTDPIRRTSGRNLPLRLHRPPRVNRAARLPLRFDRDLAPGSPHRTKVLRPLHVRRNSRG